MPPDKEKEKEIEELLLRLDAKLLERIDDFRFKNRFPNRTEAIRWLLDFALKTAKKTDLERR